MREDEEPFLSNHNSQASNRKGEGEIVHNVDTFFGLGNVSEGVLRILYTNADSLMNKVNELTVRVNYLKHDMVAINEALLKHSTGEITELE